MSCFQPVVNVTVTVMDSSSTDEAVISEGYSLRSESAAELEHLRGLLPYLTGLHPEWSAEATAAAVLRTVEALLSMIRILVAEHIGDEFQPERDRAWLREVRGRANRISNGE